MPDINLTKQNDIQKNMNATLQSSQNVVFSAIDAGSSQIQSADTTFMNTLDNVNQVTNQASTDLLKAISTKQDLAETPRIVKNIMTILGYEDYNENYQNLKIQEANARMGLAARRLDAAKTAHDITVATAKRGVDNAVTEHTLKRQGVFDKFQLSANIDEEQRRILDGMDEKALLEIKKNPGTAPDWLQNKMGLVDAQLRKIRGQSLDLESKDLTNEITRRTNEHQKRDDTLARLTSEEIRAISDGKMNLPKGISRGEIESTLQRRQSIALSLDAARKSAQVDDLKMHDLHKADAISKFNSRELKLMKERADANGGKIKLAGIEFSAAELTTMVATRQKTERAILEENVKRAADINAAQAKAGIIKDKIKRVANLSEDKQLDPELQAKMAEYESRVSAAAAIGSPDGVAKEIKDWQEALDKEVEKIIKESPKTEQGGRKEYLATGRIRRPENAYSMLSVASSNDILLADNPSLAPVWRDFSHNIQISKARYAEGMTFGDITREGGGGYGNIFLNQPKRQEDDELIQSSIKAIDARTKLGNALYQRALAKSLWDLHKQLTDQGVPSPYGRYVRDGVNGPELTPILYQEVPVDANNPNGPTRTRFNSTRVWTLLAAESVRDQKLGKLPTDQSYATNLVDNLRDNVKKFEASISPELHSSPYASAFTSLVAGDNIRALLIDRYTQDQQYAQQALELGEQVKERIDQTSRYIPTTPEEAEAMSRGAGIPPGLDLKPRPRDFEENVKRGFPTVRDKGQLQDMINILRQSNTVSGNASSNN